MYGWEKRMLEREQSESSDWMGGASAEGTKCLWNELPIRQKGVGYQEIKSTDDYPTNTQ